MSPRQPPVNRQQLIAADYVDWGRGVVRGSMTTLDYDPPLALTPASRVCIMLQAIGLHSRMSVVLTGKAL